MLWMLGESDNDIGANGDKIDLKAANVDGRNALHLTALDKQSDYTVEVHAYVLCTYTCTYSCTMNMCSNRRM